MEPKWAILGLNANSFILVFLREGGTMRDLVGWYLGWYRAARAWRLHRGLIPAPKGLCGHKEAINLACNPSGAETRPIQHSKGPTSPRSTLAYCTLSGPEAHGLSINGTAYPSLELRIEQAWVSHSYSFIPPKEFGVTMVGTRPRQGRSHWINSFLFSLVGWSWKRSVLDARSIK